MFPQLNELKTEDTALSAKQLTEHILPETTAVLCSKQAGLQHNLDLVCEHVADKINNNTLFDLTCYYEDKQNLLLEHTASLKRSLQNLFKSYQTAIDRANAIHQRFEK